jgi:HK97 family phage major capsid protein
MLARAAEFLGVETRAAMATTDVPLPVAYGKQIAELVFTYGTARKYCTVYPLSGNSMKLPRLKTGEPQFAFITISGAVPEKVPQSEFITFTPGKAGGIVRIPSEIEEDSIFDLGQFVARYIAREMAYWEDYCLFLGDGTSTYNSISGVGAQATTDSTVLQLSAGNSSSDKITIANVRTLRTKPIAAILRTGMVTSHLVRMLLA